MMHAGMVPAGRSCGLDGKHGRCMATLRALAVAYMLLLMGCANFAEPPAPSPPVMSPTDSIVIDWARVGPFKFLSMLKAARRPYVVLNTPPPVGWVREEHVPELLYRANTSMASASAVVLVESSYALPARRSSEAREALFLVQGVRTGSYPPDMNSVEYFDASLEELQQWWEDRNR